MPVRAWTLRATAAGAAILVTTSLTLSHALSQSRPTVHHPAVHRDTQVDYVRPQVPASLVGLDNARQASEIEATYGAGALWAYDRTRGRFEPLSKFSLSHQETLYAPIRDIDALHVHLRFTSHHAGTKGHRPGSSSASASSGTTADPATSPAQPAATTTTIPAPTTTTSTTTTTVPAKSAPASSAASSTASAAGSSLPASDAGSTPIFSDDFAGSALDSSNWNTFMTSNAANGYAWNSNGSGGSALGNPSLNYDAEYDLPSQVQVDNGLILQADEVPTEGLLGTSPFLYPWRSGVVTTYGKFEFTGGYLQVVAKMPSGDGIWPAIWMLPGSGASSGDNYEIDLFEGGMTNGSADPDSTFGWHLHTPSGTTYGGVEDSGVDLTAGYHTYGLDWVPGQSITWYLDGTEVGQVTSAESPIPSEPMELILSLEVANAAAASWHTIVDASTPTSAQMLVKSVDVYS